MSVFFKTKRAVRGGGQATRIRKIETRRWCALVWWETQKCFSQRIQTAGGGGGGVGGGGGGEGGGEEKWGHGMRLTRRRQCILNCPP